MSSSALSMRLAELTAAGLVVKDDDRHALSPLGERLGVAIEPLNSWADEWSETLD